MPRKTRPFLERSIRKKLTTNYLDLLNRLSRGEITPEQFDRGVETARRTAHLKPHAQYAKLFFGEPLHELQESYLRGRITRDQYLRHIQLYREQIKAMQKITEKKP